MKKETIVKILLFWLPFFTLTTISLLLMYHAKFIMETYSSHFSKQCLWFIIGIVILLSNKFINYQKLFKYAKFIYLLNIFLLVLVLFIGEDINGSKAWINIYFFNIQPSEIMKFSYTLFLTSLVAKEKKGNFIKELLFIFKVFIIYLIPTILIFLEPDTGAIIFLSIITLSILLHSNLRKRWFIVIGIILALIIFAFFYCYFNNPDYLIKIIGTTFFYRVERLFNFGTGMQIENALIAIGSASFIKFSLYETGIYIPESPTDFVFALSANVLGIFGMILIILCLFLIDCYFIYYFKKCSKKYQKIFIQAFLAMLITNEFINIGMNIGIFPIIGVPLPFVSYGGSSLIILFLFIATIFSFKKK